MANQEQLDLLNQGTDVWNAWRKQHPSLRPDLSGANLSGARLGGVSLVRANLSRANLSGARIFFGTDLTGADLSGADLSHTEMDEKTLITPGQIAQAKPVTYT
jgi:uncharacterized protein YjbI with pentapeptide repeats